MSTRRIRKKKIQMSSSSCISFLSAFFMLLIFLDAHESSIVYQESLLVVHNILSTLYIHFKKKTLYLSRFPFFIRSFFLFLADTLLNIINIIIIIIIIIIICIICTVRGVAMSVREPLFLRVFSCSESTVHNS